MTLNSPGNLHGGIRVEVMPTQRCLLTFSLTGEKDMVLREKCKTVLRAHGLESRPGTTLFSGDLTLTDALEAVEALIDRLVEDDSSGQLTNLQIWVFGWEHLLLDQQALDEITKAKRELLRRRVN